MSLARGAILCLLPQLDAAHVLADNISIEVQHGNGVSIPGPDFLDVSMRAFEKTHQCHLKQHGRFMFSDVNLVK